MSQAERQCRSAEPQRESLEPPLGPVLADEWVRQRPRHHQEEEAAEKRFRR